MKEPLASTMTIPADTGDLPHGEIHAANASRFAAAHLSQPLTRYSVGHLQQNSLLALLRSLVPEVPVARRFEFKKAENAEQFLAETEEDIRAIGASFKRVEYTGTTVQSKTFNKGLTVRIDHDEEDIEMPGWQERYVALLTDRLLRGEILRAISILDGSDTNKARTWNPAASPLLNPFAHLRDSIQLGLKASGVKPNTVAFGGTAWMNLLDLVEAHDGAIGSANLTPEGVARRLGVQRVIIVEDVYQSAAAAKSFMLDQAVYTYFASQMATRDDPSNIKRFVTSAGANPVRVYIREEDKWTDITVEHYSNIVATYTGGIRKDTISTS